MDRKPEAVSAACQDGIAKLEKIKQLNVTADMSQEAQDELVERLSEAKAIEMECDIKEVRSGQRWYVESLVEFAGQEPEEQFDTLYRKQFARQATETEILDVFRSYKA
jgi:N-methylhydantoinase A/oxoprolinase/acetone carboxylase beta subunit